MTDTSSENADTLPRSARKFATLTRWVIWLLYAQIAIAIAAIVSNYLEYAFLSDLAYGVYDNDQIRGHNEESASHLRQLVVSVVGIVLAIVCGILILIWIHRANRNVRQLGAEDMQFTPGWAVGWHFIPIANLWKPYQAVVEIWKASADPLNWQEQARPNVLPWWWVAWILAWVVQQASARLFRNAYEIGEFLAANVFSQCALVLFIALCIVFLRIVTNIAVMQNAHFQNPPARNIAD